MICTKSEFGPTQVRPELDTHGYCGQHLSFGGAVTSLRGTESATTVRDHAFNVILDLAQYTTQAKITGIRIKNILVGKARIGACMSASRRTLKADEQLVSHTNGTSYPVRPPQV